MLSLLGTLAWYAFLGLVIFYSFTLIPYLYTFFTSPLPSQLSGPKPSHWFFGEILTLQRELPYRPHIRWAKEFGGMVLYRTFFQWKVLVSDPEAIRQILVTKAQSYPKPEQFKLLKTILGKGLVTSEGETHTHDVCVVVVVVFFSLFLPLSLLSIPLVLYLYQLPLLFSSVSSALLTHYFCSPSLPRPNNKQTNRESTFPRPSTLLISRSSQPSSPNTPSPLRTNGNQI